MGLREEKKAATRKRISDTATALFFKNGFENVTTAKVAENSRVSLKTLFNYFPTKESLVFDEDAETETWLAGVISDRDKTQSILDALIGAARIRFTNAKSNKQNREATRFFRLVERTPSLNLYAKQMWMRHEKALAAVLLREQKSRLSKDQAAMAAVFILEAFNRALCSTSPAATFEHLIELLRQSSLGD